MIAWIAAWLSILALAVAGCQEVNQADIESKISSLELKMCGFRIEEDYSISPETDDNARWACIVTRR